MKENFRPIPEGAQKPKFPEPGAGPIGLPPPDPEQQPQGAGGKSPEFDLRGQGEEVGARKKARYDRMIETRIRNEILTPEERAQKQEEKQREYRRHYVQTNREKINATARRAYQRRKERRKLEQVRKEKRQEYQSNRYQKLKEQRKGDAKQQQSIQVYPTPAE